MASSERLFSFVSRLLCFGSEKGFDCALSTTWNCPGRSWRPVRPLHCIHSRLSGIEVAMTSIPPFALDSLSTTCLVEADIPTEPLATWRDRFSIPQHDGLSDLEIVTSTTETIRYSDVAAIIVSRPQSLRCIIDECLPLFLQRTPFIIELGKAQYLRMTSEDLHWHDITASVRDCFRIEPQTHLRCWNGRV